MKKKFWVLFLILAILTIMSACVGRYELSVKDIFYILTNQSDVIMDQTVFYQIRLPRTFLCIISGGALALSGLVFQNIFKNPLVSPDVLGVSSGCSIGAIIAILTSMNSYFGMQGLSFLGGILLVILAVSLSKLMEGNRIYSMLISGIIMSSLASSVIMALKYIADPMKQLPAIEYWLMGGFHNASWDNIRIVLPLCFAAGLIIYILRWKLKVLSLGDDEARSLGISVTALRIVAIFAATVLVSTVVSVAGVVSWIGLIAPHVVRVIAGDDFAHNISLSVVVGGILLLFADILARTMFTAEIPISILTSFLGAMFLLFILMQRRFRH